VFQVNGMECRENLIRKENVGPRPKRMKNVGTPKIEIYQQEKATFQ